MPLIAQVGRNKLRVKLLIGIIAGLLWLGVVLHLFPVWWMVSSSLKSYIEVLMFPPTLWPKRLSLTAYQLFYRFAEGTSGVAGIPYPMYVHFKNSVIITGGIIALQIPIVSLLAYSLSKLCPPKLNRILFLFCIGTLMVPSQMALIPSFLILAHFPIPLMDIPKIPFTNIHFPTVNFLNTYWAVILPSMYSAFNLLLLKGFFDGIPNELINAARLDGASELSIFRRIILPMSKPVFAVVGYYAFLGAWNSFMWPLIVMREEKFMPLSVILYKFQYALSSTTYLLGTDPTTQRIRESGMGYNGLMAISIIQSIPVFIIFIIFREQLMKGIKLRGFK